MGDNSYTSSSKKINWFYAKALLFVICLVPVIYFVGNKYAAASTENKINNYNLSRWNEFYAAEKNTIDTLYLGSSHSYCTFDPLIVDEILGTNGYQLGMPLQHMDTTYFTLLEALNYQTPKTVVLEVYWDMLDDEFELTQAGYLFQVIKNPELEDRYIDEVFPLSEKLKYNINVFRYQGDYFAYRNTKLKEYAEEKAGVYTPTAEKQQGTEKYRSKGYTYCDYNMLESEFDEKNQFKGFDGEQWQINNTQKKYMNKIVSECRQRGIELIFVTAPIANVSMDYIKNYDSLHNKLQSIADEMGVDYLDFNIVNRDEKLLTNENFRDDAHLNHSGVEIVDRYFAQWYKDRH